MVPWKSAILEGNLYVCVRDRETLARCRPDGPSLDRLGRQLGVAGFAVFTLRPAPRVDAAMRCFFPGYGILEDPVTGSAAGQLRALIQTVLPEALPRRLGFTHGDEMGPPGVVEVLNRPRGEIDIRKFRTLCAELRRDHDADAARVEVTFPYFIEKKAPITGAVGLLHYSCTFGASVTRDDYDLWVALEVPVTTLCPCSKAISEHGAHNQRSLVAVRVWFDRFFWIEDLIALVEDSASCDLYALLKRPDEKYVTELAWQRT